MRWKIVLEGTDEFGSAHRSELAIDKDMERLSAGEIGFSVEDGKAIMAHLQQVVVNQQCEAYVLTSLFCADCEGFRRIKDYGKRKIRTVFNPLLRLRGVVGLVTRSILSRLTARKIKQNLHKLILGLVGDAPSDAGDDV
jgi:hypothetical protein